MYGVTHAGTRHFGNGSSYHYYDERRVNSGADDLSRTAQLLTRLADQQGECLRLHTPSAVDAHAEFVLPTTLSPVDEWIDEVQDTQSAEYYKDPRHWCSA